MGMDWTALANTISGIGQGMAQPGHPSGQVNANMQQLFQAQAQQEALKKAKEEEEKKEKAGFMGKVGSALGTIGGVALAPFTGGASLLIPAAMGAAGSAVGGAAGRALGGGGFDLQQTGMDLLSGGIGGYMGGKTGGFGNAGNLDASPSAMLDTAVGSKPPMTTPGRMAGATFRAMTGQRTSQPRLIPLGDGTFYVDYGNNSYGM